MKNKVIGRVSMDMVNVDVADVKNVKVGEEVILIGEIGKSKISVNDITYLSDTIN